MLRGGVKPACSKGFTLAEVLITLAIVGIVAALTIPSLINKCQKIVWAKQAQENYAILTQAFKRVLADNNTTSLSETELWSKMHQYGFDSNDSLEEDFFTELGKYIKISISTSQQQRLVKSGETEYTTDRHYSIYFPNGAEMLYYYIYKHPYTEDCAEIKALGGSMCSLIWEFHIDVNGAKGPNEVGRDIFYFVLSDEGVLYPQGGKDFAIFYRLIDLDSNSSYWKNIYTGTNQENAKKSQSTRTGQLMEEGWKMNY
jgi:prepilin-type N-terminal cleavage/methylation domain-containing protein